MTYKAMTRKEEIDLVAEAFVLWWNRNQWAQHFYNDEQISTRTQGFIAEQIEAEWRGLA